MSADPRKPFFEIMKSTARSVSCITDGFKAILLLWFSTLLANCYWCKIR